MATESFDTVSVENEPSKLLEQVALGKINYWSTYVSDCSTALVFLAYQLVYRHGSLLFTFLATLIGYLAWGLTEYVFHRWVYHQKTWVFGEGHRFHHVDAQALIAMPWFMTTSVMIALWFILAYKLNIPYFSCLQAGWLMGFVFYSLVHHSHHHWHFNFAWLRKRKAYHRIHHHFPETNYGVTVLFWDKVFGTRYEKEKTPPSGYANQGASRQTENILQLH